MHWFKAFHIICMVAWFAGLFYLPRLFVYHADTRDDLGYHRFCTMEHKLFYFIMTPAAILTTFFGVILLGYDWSFYFTSGWMITKLVLVLGLFAYHIYCGKLLSDFKHRKNKKTQRFFRFFNEVPTLLLIAIVVLVVVKP